MGQVYLGFSPAGRPVAVKVIHAQLAADPAFRVRFAREVAAARAVSGAFTAPVTAAGPDDDPPWLATALVVGPSLAEAVAAGGPLPEPASWLLAAGLAEALAEVHGCGLVHRDLKPANVLLAMDGPRVIDFGISRSLEATVMTAAGLVVGTPAFMSPEQAAGGQVGPASDVFSLGSVLVFAGMGAGPFGDGPVLSVLYRVVHSEPAMGALPGGLRELAAACLVKDPDARPTTAQVLDAITAGAPPQAASVASFWPETLARLIRAYQARLDAELAPPHGDGGPRPSGGPRSATEPRPVAAPSPGSAPVQPTGPGLTVPPRGLVPPAPTRRLTRRRVLAGLGGAAAAGLAVTGWELSQGSPQRPPRPGPPRPPGPGTVIWRSSRGDGPFISPVIIGGLVCYPGTIHGPTGGPLYAVSASDGALAWHSDAGGGVATYLATDGKIIFFGANNNQLYAVRASSGKTVWSTRIGGGPRTNPTVSGGVIYFGGNDSRLNVLRARSGRPIGSTGTGGGPSTDVTFAGGVIYFGGNDGNLYALRASNGATIWSTGLGGGIIAAPAVASGVVCFKASNGILYAVRAADGTRIWTTAYSSTQPSPGLAITGDTVYLADDKLRALRASDGSVIWITSIGRGPATNPVPAGSVVYMGGDDNVLYALRAKDGTPAWTFRGGGRIDVPVPAAGVVYVATLNDQLYALRA
jgi:outer membrane protein assembly factor BamB